MAVARPLAPLAPLAVLEGRKIRRQGDRLALSPPLEPGELEAVKGLKPALLEVLKDGEEVTGEVLLADPTRRAGLLGALGRQEVPPSQNRRMLNMAPTQQDPWRLPPGLEAGTLSPLRGREAEIALRAQAWEVLERVRGLDRATGEAFSIRLNRAPTPEVPALLAELQEALARLSVSPPGSNEGGDSQEVPREP